MKSWTYHNDKTMLWPVILVALVISYLICVLLLDGLQKEDLDANTLEKLERHNVNIYDMNNDSLREECLSDTTGKGNNDLSEQQKYTSATLLNEQINGNLKATDNHNKSQITSRELTDTASLPIMNGILIKDGLENNNDDIKIITEIENSCNASNKATKVEENTNRVVDMNKKSSLENVLYFWNKMSHYTTEAASRANKTIDLTRREHMAFTAPVIQHSKENDYASRIIAEYLATQSALTTIPSAKKNLSIDFISGDLKHFLGQYDGGADKNRLNDKERNYMYSFDTAILIPKSDNRYYTTQTPLRIYSTPQDNNFYNNKQIGSLKDTRYIGDINTANKENLQNKEGLKYLDDIVRFNEQFNIDTQSAYLEKSIKNRISNENEKQQTFRYTDTENIMYKDSSKLESNGIPSANFARVSAGGINALEKFKDTQHIGEINTVNKESVQKQETLHYWDDILRFGKQFNIDAQIPYAEKNSQNRNYDENARQQISTNYMLPYISEYQNNKIRDSNKNQYNGTSSNNVGTVSAAVINAQLERLKGIQHIGSINTVTKENIPKQAALQDDILRSNKQFGIDAQILSPEKNTHDRINYENYLQQISRNYMLPYISEAQNNNSKDSSKNQGNGIPRDPVGTISGEVINPQTERLENMQYIGNSNTVNTENIQKQAALQYLDDIIRFSKQFNTQIPYSEKNTQIRINNDNKRQQTSRNKMLPYITEAANNNIKNSIKIQSNTTPSNDVGLVSANVINEIAQKVKEIVITDLRREMPITHEPTTSRHTMITTAVPVITTSIKETLITLQKETEEKNEFSKTIIEIFKEYKTLKERNDSITTLTNSIQNATFLHIIPPTIAKFNTYDLQANIANIEQKNMNPYIANSLVVSWAYPEKPLYPKSNYRLPPITIQTNSDQVPPLAIQLSNPITLIDQHIISPSVNAERLAMKQQFSQNLGDLLHTAKGKNSPIEYSVSEGHTSKPNTETKIFRDSYKDSRKSAEILTRIQKLQDRIKYASEYKRKIENADRPSNTAYRVENSLNYSLGQFSESNHQSGSEHHDTFNWPLKLPQNKYPNRPLDFNHERHIHSNYEDHLNQLRNWQHRDKFQRPEDKNYKALNRFLDFKHLNALNEPLGSKYRQLLNENLDYNMHKVDPSPRDVATYEILNQISDSHHSDLLNRLIKSNPTEHMNRLMDHYGNSHLLKEYIRNEPHPQVSKYHEKLEELENLSSNNYKSYSKITTQSFCDGIASRQQMPLSNTNPQRTRFDDTHFKNFLKSQQKVNEILEKILAAKTKPDFQSIETA